MRTLYSLLIATFLLLITSAVVTQTANAQCNSVGNGFGGVDITCTGNNVGQVPGTASQDMAIVQPGANVTNSGDVVIDLMQGPDTFIMNGGNVERTDGVGNVVDGDQDDDTFIINGGTISGTTALNPASGNDDVTINDGMLSGQVNLASGNDTFNMFGGTVITDFDTINGAGDDDIVNIFGGTVIGGTDGTGHAVNLGSGNDTMFASNTTLTGGTDPGFGAITGGSGNDEIAIGTGLVLNGSINCSDGVDTLIFAMEVPDHELPSLSSIIRRLDPQGGTITINGLVYVWEECESIVDNLVGVPAISPVPTLSQWGLIATAALIGVFGFFVARKRFQTN